MTSTIRMESRSPWLLPLERAESESSVGAKASRLSTLQALGFNVPPGLIIPHQAFAAFLTNRLAARIHELVRQASTPADNAAASEAIHDLVLQADLPHELQCALAAARDELKSLQPLIVRSSAVGEDSATAAFAGQLDSIMHVTVENLEISLRHCWASYWSARCLAYQRHRHVNLDGMAVLVQQQVKSATSGVLFSRDPRCTAASSPLVIEFCAGYGDQLVEGRVDPYRIVVDPSDARWNWDNPAGVDVPQTGLPMGEAVISQLVDAGLTLSEHFGVEQDLEWTVDGRGELYLVQARPITTSPVTTSPVTTSPVTTSPAADQSESSANERGETTVWSNANVNENYPEPISPLLYSIASEGYYHYFRNLGLALGVSAGRVDQMERPLRNLIGVHHGHMYYNLTNIHAVLRSVPGGEWLTSAFNLFVGAAPTRSQALESNRKRSPGERASTALELLRIGRSASRRFRRLSTGVAAFEQKIDDFAQRTTVGQLERKSKQSLVGDVGRFMDIRCHGWTDAALADAASMISYGLWKKIVNVEFPDDDYASLHNSLLKGLRDVVSGEPVADLWHVSRMLRADDQLKVELESRTPVQAWEYLEQTTSHEEFVVALRSYLDRWGYRCSGELMLTTPSYQECPHQLIPLILHYARMDGPSPQERGRDQHEARLQKTEQVLRALSRRRLFAPLPWPRKGWLARRCLRWTQMSIALRERARLKQALLYSRLRRVVLELGQRLVDAQLLNDANDVFMLSVQELQTLADGRFMHPADVSSLIELRRAAHQRFLNQDTLPSRLELPIGEYLSFARARPGSLGVPAAEQQLRGDGVCGGQARGRAVVARDVSDFGKVREHDVLVARQTDPGWGPVLFMVRGLVMERGGMLSHGAILAREFGIPTVVGIPRATEIIQDGDSIAIDGDRGLVEIGE